MLSLRDEAVEKLQREKEHLAELSQVRSHCCRKGQKISPEVRGQLGAVNPKHNRAVNLIGTEDNKMLIGGQLLTA